MKTPISSAKRITDMTTGSPLQLILSFGLPLILGNTLQQVYSMIDTVVLGRFNGVQGLAVLGSSAWAIWLSVSFMTNFAQASSLLLAKRFGARKPEEMKQAAGNIYVIALILGCAMVMLFQPLVRPLLLLLQTAPELLEDAVLYLRITFAGIPIVLAYNLYSAFLRAVGDSRTPLYAILAASVVNVVLDVWFVAALNMGAPGAAIATVTAQFFSALVCFLRVRTYDMLRVNRSHLRLSRPLLREFFALSIPMLMQSFVIAFGGFFVQSHINAYGAAFTAGMSASTKVFSLLETACIALAQASATFVSQNYGARRFDRIRSGMRVSLSVSLVIASALLICMFFLSEKLLALFVAPEAFQTAHEMTMVMSIGMLAAYPMYSLRQGLQALGNSVVPLIAAVVQLIVRVSVTLVFPLFLGQRGMYFTSAGAWISSLILIGAVFPFWLRRCEAKAAAED